jgi:hypothetical protein
MTGDAALDGEVGQHLSLANSTHHPITVDLSVGDPEIRRNSFSSDCSDSPPNDECFVAPSLEAGAHARP